MDKRYIRNINALSPAECKKLNEAKVCIVGCGGLGGYIIEMIGRLGIGNLTVVDGDFFERTNLNRQILSDEDSIGINKALKAVKRMNKINSDVSIKAVSKIIDQENAEDILIDHDVIIDAVDNIKTRFILQKSCRELNIPLVHGAIAGWFGQVTTILPGDDTLNYIYKNKLDENDSGIEKKLGNPSFIPAQVASIQVAETVKLLIRRGELLRKKIMFIDLLEMEYNILNI